MENTMMTDSAATNTDSASTSTGAATTTTTVDTGAAQQQQASQGGNQTSATNPAQDGQTQGAQDGTTAQQQGAPEKYEFKAPENVVVDEATLGDLSAVAKELNLPQESAQKILDKLAPAVTQRGVEALAKLQQGWADGSKLDKEFGGDKLTENLSVAKKALDTFGSPELRSLLNESGLGNHPEVIRLLYRAGKSISEDKFVSGGTGNRTSGKDFSKALYPNQ